MSPCFSLWLWALVCRCDLEILLRLGLSSPKSSSSAGNLLHLGGGQASLLTTSDPASVRRGFRHRGCSASCGLPGPPRVGPVLGPIPLPSSKTLDRLRPGPVVAGEVPPEPVHGSISPSPSCPTLLQWTNCCRRQFCTQLRSCCDVPPRLEH